MNQENKQTEMKLEDFINLSLIIGASNHCRDCGGERKTIRFEQIPKLLRPLYMERMNQEPFKNKKNEFIYCKKCDAISILSEPFHLKK